MRVAQWRLARGAAGGVKPNIPVKSPIFCSISAHSASGTEPSTIPAPENRASLFPRTRPDLMPTANSRRPSDPTDRACVPPAIEGLGAPDLLERTLLRVPTNRRRGMQRPQHLGVRNALAQDPPYPGQHVTPARQLHLRDAALDLELVADRSERLADAGLDVLVLRLVLLAAERSSRSSSSSASDAPRGLVPATASLSMARPSRRKSRSGEAQTKATPSSGST